jgi:hypothetical protein
MMTISMPLKSLNAAIIAAAFFICCGNAEAEKRTLYLKWSGSGAATAEGYISFDSASTDKIWSVPGFGISDVIDFEITISGAAHGNGTFAKSDFEEIYINSPSALDISKELMGQHLTNGYTFGPTNLPDAIGQTGEFLIRGNNAAAPIPVFFFTFETGGTGSQVSLTLTSASPIPEQGTLFYALAGLTFIQRMVYRRNRNAQR